MALHFKLTTPFSDINMKSFALDDVNILNPTNANPLVLGEWLELTDTYKMKRGSGAATVPSYCHFMEQGRYDTQAIGKSAFMFLNEWEADTKVFDTGGTYTVGEKVCVADVTFGGIASRRGLKELAASEYVVAVVTRIPANNNGYLRVRRVG